jgi:hypothetical protein
MHRATGASVAIAPSTLSPLRRALACAKAAWRKPRRHAQIGYEATCKPLEEPP